MYEVIATGSKGNAVIYSNKIMVDCGVPFSSIKSKVKDLKLILLTHIHGDHINISTLRKIQQENPTVRIGCCGWMLPLVQGLRNVDIFTPGNRYDYLDVKIIPFNLYHDVENCGYKIMIGEYKIFHATDTAHLEGIKALHYDLYAVEHNYNEETIHDIIFEKESRGEFAHQRGSLNSHLSEQQAKEFIFKNRKHTSQVLRLHESSSMY